MDREANFEPPSTVASSQQNVGGETFAGSSEQNVGFKLRTRRQNVAREW